MQIVKPNVCAVRRRSIERELDPNCDMPQSYYTHFTLYLVSIYKSLPPHAALRKLNRLQ
jgi:hypothetical protein